MSRSTSDTAKAVAKVLYLKPDYKDFPQLLGEELYPHDKVWAETFKELIQVELNIMEFKEDEDDSSDFPRGFGALDE